MHLPPNWGTFGALIVSFLAFWFIFRRLFFDPFLKLLGERERRLREFGQRTEHLIEEGKEADAQRERELAALRREALARRDAERRQAEEEAAHMIEQAKTEARASMERAREAIEREVASAESRLDAFARALADDLAERVLGRPLKASAKNQ
ncbi:MAG: ATP synthase F0 subunit B [Candidatus Binataceae bacterium]